MLFSVLCVCFFAPRAVCVVFSVLCCLGVFVLFVALCYVCVRRVLFWAVCVIRVTCALSTSSVHAVSCLCFPFFRYFYFTNKNGLQAYTAACSKRDNWNTIAIFCVDFRARMPLRALSRLQIVVEAGLGGRLDSTNIITPALSIITSIG